jgi:hypothetical protein
MPSWGGTCSARLDPTNSCAPASASMMHPNPGVRGRQPIGASSGTYHRASRAAFRRSGLTMTPEPFISCSPATIRFRCVGRPSRSLTEQIRSVSQASVGAGDVRRAGRRLMRCGEGGTPTRAWNFGLPRTPIAPRPSPRSKTGRLRAYATCDGLSPIDRGSHIPSPAEESRRIKHSLRKTECSGIAGETLGVLRWDRRKTSRFATRNR